MHHDWKVAAVLSLLAGDASGADSGGHTLSTLGAEDSITPLPSSTAARQPGHFATRNVEATCVVQVTEASLEIPGPSLTPPIFKGFVI